MNTLTIWPSFSTHPRQRSMPTEICPDLAFAPTNFPGAPANGKRSARCPRRSALAESILASRQMAESA